MKRFINEIDFTKIINDCINESWFFDYLLLKLIYSHENNTIPMFLLNSEINQAVRSMKFFTPFPLEKIKDNSDIILYGAGNHGKKLYVYLRIKQSCNIILWVDKNRKAYTEINLPVSEPDDIYNKHFDVIFIAIGLRLCLMLIMTARTA